MGYKVGDEVLLKVTFSRYLKGDAIFDFTGVDGERHKICPSYKTICKEPEMTAEEAWELARKIVGCREHGLEETKRREIFSRDDAFDVFNLFSAKEAKAKIEEWKAAKEIEVGDEVALKDNPNKDDFKFFVTKLDRKENAITGVSGFDGGVFWGRDIMKYQKTGRHIDIAGLLKQIGGDE